MTARLLYEPHPVRRPRAKRPTVDLNACSVTIVGTQPILSIVVDVGDNEPVYVLKLDTVQQAYVYRKIGAKLPGAQHE